MNLRLLLAVVVILMLSVSVIQAQNCNLIPIIVEAAPNADTMFCGFHTSGTAGIDASILESEAPPAPPTGVHANSWTDPAGVLNPLYHYDMRAASSAELFVITFQPDSGYKVVFRFPGAAYLNARFDSVSVWDYVNYDPATGAGYLFNMATVPGDSYRVPDKSGINKNPKYTDLLISTYGTKAFKDTAPPYHFYGIIGGVRLENPTKPEGFSLHQNYPNPFNPTTTVKFDIAQEVDAQVAVFDVLGRKVATLTSERLMPGTYSTVWNGTNDRGVAVGSGVYYIRMAAHANSNRGKQQDFSAVRKVLLMK